MTSEPGPPSAAGSAPRGGGGFAAFVAAAVAVAAFLAAAVALRPPAPLGADAPPDRFSARRAETELRTVFRDVPHPSGSAEHAAVRDRLVARMRELGLSPRVERRWTVTPSAQTAAWVENVVARIPGAEEGPPVVLCSHYDSVAAGPGASDAAMCVAAILETARALAAGPPLPRGVVLLVTDGEEAGMLGARAHLAAHGTDDVLAVVNLEARGTTGPSLMFETGPGSARTVGAWRRGAPRPVTSSLFGEVYRRLRDAGVMRNDTDLSVFRDAGVPGLNFAMIGDVQTYHTPLDSVARVDLGTLQQHGDNALAAVRGIAAAGGDLGGGAADAPEAVWCDLLSLVVVQADARDVPYAAWGAVALVAVAAWLRRRRGDVRLPELAVGAAAHVAALVAACGCVVVTGRFLTAAGALPQQFVASPAGAFAAAAGAAAIGAAVVAFVARRWARPAALHLGAWAVLAAGGVWASGAFPGGSHLFVLPALLAGATSVAAALVRGSTTTAESCVGVGALGVLWFPLALHLGDAVGVGPIPGAGLALVAAGLPMAVVAAALVPALSGDRAAVRAAGLGGAAVVVVGAVALFRAEPFTPDLPRPLRFVWTAEEDDHGHGAAAHWVALPASTALPAEVAAAARWGDDERVLPWRGERGPAAEAPAADVPGPVLADLRTESSGGSRRVRFRLASRRGATTVMLAVDPAARLRRVIVGGVQVPAESLRGRGGGAFALTCVATPPEGVAFDLDFASDAPVTAYVADATPGLPPGADDPARARPATHVPAHGGDETVVHRRVRL